MTNISQIEFLNTASTIKILGIVNDKVSVKGQLYKGTCVIGKYGTLMRGTTRITITEIVTFTGLDFNLAVVTTEFITEIGSKTVFTIGSANILTVK